MAEDDLLGSRKPERETLLGTREWYEQVVINKVADLTLEQASKVMTPSGISLLGVIKHLAWAEAGWFRDTFAGESDFTEVSMDESFVIEPGDTTESVVDDYRDECARSQAIIDAAASLDDLSTHEIELRGHVSLRWILVHMLEETARHAGHLDIMREHIDGKTGDG